MSQSGNASGALGIFRPAHLGCPVCNTDPKRHTAYATSAHEKLADDRYKGYGCGHEFALFEALRAGCHETFGILATFSHWQWFKEETVVVGRLAQISVPVPSGVKLFAAFLTPHTPADGPQIHYLPRVVDLNNSELLISTTGATTTPPEMLGKEMRLMVGVYGHSPSESSGWARLLYESLTDFSEHKYSMAIFKLATSLEIACDRTFETYLERKGVPVSLVQRLLRSGRNWEVRMGRLGDITPTFLEANELEAFQTASKTFLETVRVHRNAFAHDDPDKLDHKDASEAFATCFPILWGVERILVGKGLD